MKMDQKADHFIDKARDWDKGSVRVQNAHKIANKIMAKIDLSGKEHIMDFGAGTGLLSEGIAPHIHKLTAIDFSAAMLEKFQQKSWPCETEVLNIDLIKANLDYEFDGIISSMTMHHINQVDAMMNKLYSLLKKEGFIAIADLEKEDGTFHKNNAGVAHFGFDPAAFAEIMEKSGFRSVNTERVHMVRKEVDGSEKEFPVFLAIAFK
jgi:predicted TPR repeat methyltransferase